LVSVTLAPGKVIQYGYDARNLVTNITDWLGGATSMEYDAAARLRSISRPNGVTTTFGYDSVSRLVSIHEGASGSLASIELTRDAAGHIVSALKELPLQPALQPGRSERSYDAASQILGAEYDALGRMTQDGPRSFEWDMASRLVRVEDATAATTFEYDAFGSLLAWTQGAERREFVWNYGLVLRSPVILREGQADLYYAVHTPRGELLYTIDAANGTRHFHHFDESGNTVLLTDDAGAVTDAFAGSPYGMPLGRQGTTFTPFSFAGRYSGVAQPGHGLVYLRHRWLDTENGRFLSRDPNWGISINPNEINPYAYSRSNPLRYVDPLGLDARVNQSGVHTDISVDIWQGDQVVGTLTVSYAAKGYTGKFGGLGEAFSTVIGGTQGEFSIDYKEGSIKENTSPDAISRGTQIIIEGTREQDERLRLALAGIIGANGDVAFVGRGQSMIRQFIHQARSGKNIRMVIDATIDDWETYRALTQSCNDFTDAMLDVYFGENWYVGPIFEGDGLTQELKEYLNRPRGPVLDPNGIARITGDTVVR
jgi:RHS repeat-associated protein